MESIILALIAFLGWGVGDIFGTISSRKIGAYPVAFWSILIGVICASILIPFVYTDLFNLTFEVFLVNIIIGVVFIFGWICFNEGLRIGNPSIVGTISACFAAVTVVLSALFFKEELTQIQFIAVCIIFIGLILTGLDTSSFDKLNSKVNKGIFLGFLTMISWGIYYTFIRIPVEQIGWFWPQYITLLLFPAIYFYMKIKKLRFIQNKFSVSLLPLVLYGILVAGGEFAYNYAISQGFSSIVAPIAGAYPVLFVALAFYLFKEKIAKHQIAGITLSLIGITLLSFLSI